MLKKDETPLPFSIHMDPSNKSNRKMFPMTIQFFTPECGVVNKMIDFIENPDKSAEWIVGCPESVQLLLHISKKMRGFEGVLLLQSWSAVKSYFISLGDECPKQIRTLLKLVTKDDGDVVDIYLLFCINILSLFEEVVKKLEASATTCVELYPIMHSISAKLKQSNWLHCLLFLSLPVNLTFNDLEKICEKLHLTARVNMDDLYDECTMLNIVVEKLQEWNKDVAAEWMAVCQAADLPNMLSIISCILSTPASTGFVERILSRMNSKWSEVQNRCSVEFMESELIVSVNFDLYCDEFHTGFEGQGIA
eukprot:superscaffoldBa00003102_g16127